MNQAAMRPGERPSYRTNLLLFGMVLFALTFGLNILLASTSYMAEREFGDTFYYFRKQALFTVLAIIVLIVSVHVPADLWKRLAWPLYLASLLALVLVFIPGIGKRAGGASRWINLGFFTFQPSDIARFGLILVLARIYGLRKEINFNTIWISLAVISAPALLIGVEPDFGTAIQITLTGLLTLFFTGFPLSVYGAIAISGIPIIYYAVIRVPFRLERVRAFLDPWQFRYDAAFQLVASYKSFLAGGIWGQGLGEGLKRFNLQARHTDFIAAVIAEDLGFMGIMVITLLLFAIAITGLLLVRKADDDFARLAATGVLVSFIAQVIINLAVAMGLIPTTGINLPFFSYGGTSLLSWSLMFGFVLSVIRTETN